MDKLIWFSIPGGIAVFSIGLVLPIIFNGSYVGITIVAIPILGFIIQQVWRLFFELFWGYNSKNRNIISTLMRDYNLNNNDAFLLWELTLYSENISDSFRNHDRGVWHYVMSFYSCSLASIISIYIICLVESIKN